MSRIIPSLPNLVREVRDLRRRLDRLEAAASAAPVGLTRAGAAGGATFASSSMTDLYTGQVTRGVGSVWWAEGRAFPTGASGMELRLVCPSLLVEGPVVPVASTATAAWVRLRLDIPDSWAPGEAFWLHVQGRVTSGADACRFELARIWQR